MIFLLSLVRFYTRALLQELSDLNIRELCVYKNGKFLKIFKGMETF